MIDNLHSAVQDSTSSFFRYISISISLSLTILVFSLYTKNDYGKMVSKELMALKMIEDSYQFGANDLELLKRKTDSKINELDLDRTEYFELLSKTNPGDEEPDLLNNLRDYIDKIYFQQLLENKSVVFDQNDMNISELGLNVHIHDYIPLTSCVLFVLLLTSILVLLKGSNYLQEASKLKEYNSNVFRIAIGAPINNHQLTFFKILLYTWLFLPSLMYVSTVLINNYYEIFFTEKHYLFHDLGRQIRYKGWVMISGIVLIPIVSIVQANLVRKSIKIVGI